MIEKIYIDNRGEINNCNFSGTKFNVLHSKKGSMRSGDYHPNFQYDVILKGKVQIITCENNNDVKIIYYPNRLIKIPPSIPHLFIFLEDTIMIEWWDGEMVVEYYKPYRDLVEANIKGE